jgi:hypothetical protein
MKSRLALLAAACLALSACSTMSKMWPFHKKAKPGPTAVHEFNLVNADGSEATYPQYWVRNTLVLDLSGVSGTGSVAARLPNETTWPVRVAVRVRPGSVDQLEVLGEERDVLPVSKDGAKPIDLTLAPSVYTPKTAAIYISWGPQPVFVDTSTPTPDPGFVSPQQLPPGVSAPATSARSLPPNTVPRLNIVWNCDNCERNDKVIPLLLQSYREEASKQGRTVSDAETADVFIVDFRQRNPNKRAWLGIMAGKDRLGVKIRFRGQILEANDYSANAWMGMNHLCETVGKKTLKQVRTVH